MDTSAECTPQASSVIMDANLFMVTRSDADTDRDDLRVLESMDTAAESLLKQGKTEKALEYMRMALRVRRRVYSDRSEETLTYCKALLRQGTAVACTRLEGKDVSSAIRLLEGIQEAVSGISIEPQASEICGLFNSLALAYRRQGDLPAAKRYISKALQIAESCRNAQMDRAAAHLNMCVIQSILQKHKDALESGLKSVQFAQEDLVDMSLEEKSDRSERVTLLAIAYHNVGVENEHLRKHREAVNWYTRGVKLLERHGRNPELLGQLQHTLKAALKSMANREKSPEQAVWRRTPEREDLGYRSVASASSRRSEKLASRPSSYKRDVRTLLSPRKVENLMKKRSSEPAKHERKERIDKPIETPPDVYQQFAISNSTGCFPLPSVPSQPKLSSKDLNETDQSLRDLAALGVMNYSQEIPMPKIRVRGRKRGGGQTHFRQSENLTSGFSSPEVGKTRKTDYSAEPKTDPELALSPPWEKDETSEARKRTEFVVPNEGGNAIKDRKEDLQETQKPSAGLDQRKVQEFALEIEDRTIEKSEESVLQSTPANAQDLVLSKLQISELPPPLDEKKTTSATEEQKSAVFIQGVNLLKTLVREEEKPAETQLKTDSEVLEKYATKIQAAFRARRAHRKVALLTSAKQKSSILLLRTGRKLRDGTYATLTIHKEGENMIVTATSPGAVRTLEVQGDLTPEEIAKRVDSNESGGLGFAKSDFSVPEPESTTKELTKVATSIQAVFRGQKARKLLKLKRGSEGKRTILARSAKEVGPGQYGSIVVYKEEDGNLVVSFTPAVNGAEPIESVVPIRLKDVPFPDLMQMVQVTPESLVFPNPRISEIQPTSPRPRNLLSNISLPPPDQPASPKSDSPGLKLTVTLDVEGKSPQQVEEEIFPRLTIENGQIVLQSDPPIDVPPEDMGKVTKMQSIFRMKKERAKFKKRQEEESRGQVLIQQEKTIDTGSYLITISLHPDNTLEFEAYPLSRGTSKPTKTSHSDVEVRTLFGWKTEDPWEMHKSELFRAVEIDREKVILKGRELMYQTESMLGTKDEFGVACYRQGTDIIIEAQSRTAKTTPAAIKKTESALKEMVDLTEDWRPVHWKDVISMLQIDPENRLFLSSASQVAAPKISIQETTSENVLRTDLYRRMSYSPIMHSENLKSSREKAALLIQSQYRRHISSEKARFRRAEIGKKLLIYRTYKVLEGGIGFVVQIYHHPSEFAVEAVSLSSEMQIRAGIPEENQSLEGVKSILDEILRDKGGFQAKNPPSEIDEKEAHSAAVRIQKNVRAFLIRRKYAHLKSISMRKLRFSRKKLFSSEEFYITIYSIKESLEIEAFKVYKTLHLKYRSQSIFLTKEKLQEFYMRQPTFEMIHEDLILESGRVKLMPRVRYSEVLPDRNMLPNLSVNVLPIESRTILRTSKKLGTKMWVVTMSVTDSKVGQTTPQALDLIEFSAFYGGLQVPYRISASLGQLAIATSQPLEAVHPIGFLVINHMLKVQGNNLLLDLSAPLPDFTILITRIQAQVRGFLARRRHKIFPSSNILITCQKRVIKGTEFILSAYSDIRGIVIEAVNRHKKLVLHSLIAGETVEHLPPNLDRKKVIEDFIFPQLEIGEEGDMIIKRLPIMDTKTTSHKLDKYFLAQKSRKSETSIRSVRRAHTFIAALLEIPPKKISNWRRQTMTDIPRKLISTSPRPTESFLKATQKPPNNVFEIAEETDEKREDSPKPQRGKAYNLFSLPMASTLLKGKKLDFDREKSPVSDEELKSFDEKRAVTERDSQALGKKEKEKLKLVVRSGLEIEGNLYTATIYEGKTALLVDLVHSKTKEILKTETDLPLFEDNSDRDEYCSELLGRISISTDSSGQKRIEIAPSPDSPSVLYRRSHYISDRYCVITVTETVKSLVLWLFDPSKNLQLSLSVLKSSGSELGTSQKEVQNLIKRLRIETNRGPETLVLADN